MINKYVSTTAGCEIYTDHWPDSFAFMELIDSVSGPQYEWSIQSNREQDAILLVWEADVDSWEVYYG